MAAACLLAPLSVGCQYGGQAAVHHPAFDQLEQGCFGYEPTVWRTMPGDCEQAVRMIPDEVVHTPRPAPARVPAEMTAPPQDESAQEGDVQDGALLNDVPDGGPLGVVPGIVRPPSETPQDAMSPAETPNETVPEAAPAAVKPPAVSPNEVPDVPAIVPVPAAEPKVPPAKIEPKVPPAKIEPPVSSLGPQFGPTLNAPVARSPAARTMPSRSLSRSRASANALFRTVSTALGDTAHRNRTQPNRMARKPAAANLSKFISY